MKIRFLFTAAALAVMFAGVQHVAAQQMSPYAMAGGYQPANSMAYPAPYMPAPPPQYGVRQAGMVQPPATLAPQPGAVEYGDCNACTADACGPTLGACNQCGGIATCWCHHVAVWGDYLYLRQRNAEVAYGVPINGAIVPAPTNPIQIGSIGITDPDFSSGFRFGFGFVLDGCSSISLQYTWFEETTADSVATGAPNVLRSLVSHPGTFNAARDFLSADAAQRTRFDFLDIDYRRVLDNSCNHTVTFLTGTRLGQYSQDFGADFFYTGTESVDTEIDFYGAGLRLGLEAEGYSNSRRWLCYGKTAASFVAGSFTADYDLVDSFDPEVVDTTWKAGRIVPMLDLELGVGWQSRCGTWRITGGYMLSAWFNTVSTDEWIKAVQSNNFVGLSDSTSFDGLVLRCEGRF